MKITWAQYYEFLHDFDNGTYSDQRLGQAFMNKFKISGNQQLFSSESRGVCCSLIILNYLEKYEE